jgi:hypothetical protein
MNIWIELLLVLHIIGVGALLSGFFSQMKNMKTGMKMSAGVFHGAWIMLITGMAMAGMEDPSKLNVVVVAIKAMALTAIFFIAFSFNKKEVTPKWVVPTITALTVLNICLAVLGPVVNG